LRNFIYHITHCLIFLLCFSTHLLAQDSTKRVAPATPPATSTPSSSPGASVNNPNLTVPPIIQPAEPRAPRRRRRVSAADSLRLALQRDSIAKAQAAALAAANGSAPTNNSAFNIGTPNNQPNPTVDSSLLQANTPPSVSAVPEVPMLSTSTNPFDILRAAAPSGDSSQVAAKPAPEPSTDLSAVPKTLLNKETYSKNFLFWVFLLTLLLMAFVAANARSAVGKAYNALISDNSLRQIYREQIGWGNVAELALYGLFWLNAAIFSFLMLYHLGVSPKWGQFWTFLACLVGVTVAFASKHFILYLIASVFPIGKEVRLYNYIIVTAGILLGFILLPLNIFIAYAPLSMTDVFIYCAIGAIGLVYVIRSLRSLGVASPYMMTDQFHFLIYLCAVEIAPLAILVKFLLSQTA
jgi:Domain of unknown function (DUF4271)